ncbi:florfenicol exporter, putative [Cordyceps militaris CM01]|uniref:Florfenicol exporter, putative n=1 Tax=Cordyceps militaris (strain CM01) TaxID=983644 RepID=G3JKC3_CORMM|nr:florfenicol exporter, putative [Cordyceps militaris CM01]EGX91407.1 florfenicol exporter, putative [Cordyceps militaris CM01]
MDSQATENSSTAASAPAVPPASPSTTSHDNGRQQDDPGATPAAAAAHSVFSQRTKVFVIVMTVFATFFSPFSSFLYLPALTPIADAYQRSLGDVNLTVTLYQVMQALSPLFFGDLSDQVGRRPVYAAAFAIYLAANVALAVQRSFGALLFLRALQSTGSSATVAIGNAVVADLTTPAERGGYITAVQATIMFAPALAPVLGGILTQYWGWRSTFWFLVVAAGVFVVIYVPFVPETARNVVGNGSIPPPTLNKSIISTLHWRRKRRDLEAHPDAAPLPSPKPRPNRIPLPNIWAAVRIAFEKDVGLLLLFNSLLVMSSYAVLVPLQDVIRRQYRFNDLQVGLCYIPYAVGNIVGALVMGGVLNWNYARVARSVGMTPDRKRNDELRRFPIERARIDPVWPWVVLAIATTACWGWVVDSGANLAAPLVVLFFQGIGVAGPMSALSTVLVDLYPANAGRVSSTFNLTRAAVSAIASAVVQLIIDAWGYGYTYLFLGLLLLVASPSILCVRIWGPKWREARYKRMEK